MAEAVQHPDFRPALNAVVLHYLPDIGSIHEQAVADLVQQDQYGGSSRELPSIPNVHEGDQMQKAAGAANNLVDLEVVPDEAIASGSHVAEVGKVKLCGLSEQIDFFEFVDEIAPDQDEIEFFAQGVRR